jgi:hypothetical protein
MKKEVEMIRRICLAVLCIVVLSTATATADIGVINLTLTPITFPGTLDVDLQVNVTTSLAASPSSGELLFMLASMYYPTPFGSHTTTVLSSTFVPRIGTSPVFSYTFQLTAPVEGTWGTYAFAYGFGAAGTYNSDYSTVAPVILDVAAIPAVTPVGIAVLGALLAGVGFFILRRT